MALASLQLLLAGPLAAQELDGNLSTRPPGPGDASSAVPQAGLVWELVEPAGSSQINPVATAPDQTQAPSTADPLAAPSTLAWELVTPGQETSDTAIASEIEAAQASKAEALEALEAVSQTRETSRWIVGIGGGARIGAGEPTYGMAYGRLGVALNDDLALSIRPSYIFGNSDQFGEANNEGAFQMPVTLDFAPDHWISPYVGVGIATNTDSNGSTDLLLSAGLDFRLTKNISIVTGLNYIRQTDDGDGRDIEGITVLYLRF